MYDLQQSGSCGFSDYKHAFKDAGALYRALQYANNINSLLMVHCNDETLSNGGMMNEGEVSTKLGLKGMPAFAEEINLERNLSILEETGGKLHINSISSKGSVDLIKKAKSKELNVTCGVSAFNLVLDDSSLLEFDSHFKLNPPLRTKKDIAALRSALESGIIDVVISDHCPHDVESKDLEFDLAEFGAVNLQTALPSVLEKYEEKDLSQLIEAITTNPRKVLQINIPKIEINEEANLTIFSQHASFSFDKKFNLSLSDNSPYLNKTFQSKVIGIINGTKNYFN
jgi:dihydroorotase